MQSICDYLLQLRDKYEAWVTVAVSVLAFSWYTMGAYVIAMQIKHVVAMESLF